MAITKQVYEEIQKNPETLQALTAYGNFNILPVDDDPCYQKLSKRYPWLHNGEISVLCLGLEKQQEHARYFCIIDERARTLKDTLQMQIHGTVGMLIWQKDRRELSRDECHDLYRRFIGSSFRIKEEILAGLIR